MSKKLGHLEPVELSDIWPDEAQNFTPWLARKTLSSLVKHWIWTLNLKAQGNKRWRLPR